MLLGKCKDITRLLSDELDRPLSLDERLRVRVHLPACTGCRNYRMQIRMLREAARVAGGNNEPRNE
ncbi:zinc-finger family protein [Burkholderia pseudomallei]|uniref:zf-HC2 domain-containing protein n=1 Tax=Burkholderia pseudomallei TaxID=28450 RepID=UPI00050DC9BD|nr:zf-HC2 domain-containing protein [Burkholderia pseudomallei]KGC74450.1 zinc-finger family protein [Burkholderia pseudomallei]KGV19242.1 zinc-finger family protein [Burkholderia pseudomallei TSV 43]KGV32135.1 zinc-finger family protein [Burkholderia pseudomallei TSV 31]